MYINQNKILIRLCLSLTKILTLLVIVSLVFACDSDDEPFPEILTNIEFSEPVISGDSVVLSWEEVEGATRYILFQGNSTVDGNITSNTYTVANLEPNKEYVFSLQACKAYGCFIITEATSMMTAPDEPTDFVDNQDENTATTLSLSWVAPLQNGADHYALYQVAPVSETISESISGTEYVVSNLDANTEYTFGLVACNRNNICSSTNQRTATTPPTSPADLIASKVGFDHITISWTETEGTTSYILKQGDTQTTAPSPQDQGSFDIQGLDEETPYTFSLQACNAGGCSESATVTATTEPIPNIDFSEPVIFGDSVVLSWEQVEGVSKYVLFQGNSEVDGNITTNTYTVANLEPNKEYTFSLQACKAYGCFVITEATSMMTAPDEPTAFVDNQDENTATTLSLSWVAPLQNGADHYALYQVAPVSKTISESISGTEYVVSNLDANTEYTFGLVACNRNNICSSTNQRTATTPPTSPADLIASKIGFDRITISWTEPAGTTSYVLKRGDTQIAAPSPQDQGSFDIQGLNGETPYTFSLQACSAGGCSEAATVTATTGQAPSVPAGFAKTSVNQESIEFQWGPSAHATTYKVVYINNIEITSEVSVANFRAGGLKANTGYTFSVSACNAYGCSTAANFTVSTAPIAPSSLAHAETQAFSVTLNWNQPAGASQYIIYQDNNPIITNTGSPPHKIDGLTPNKTYKFFVKVCNSSGCSDGSSEISVTTPDAPDFFTIRYPNMDSTVSDTSTPEIVSGKNCDIETFTAEGKAIYNIAVNTSGITAPTLPTINANTGKVANNGSASPGAYKVSITVAEDVDCNTNVLVYNTVKPADLIALKAELFNTGSGINLYGDTGNYNYIITSEITDMNSLFKNKGLFNGDITEWDTSQVVIMSDMFSGLKNFSQPIGGWNTSKVEKMDYMFYGTTSFNQPIGGWDTSKVRHMEVMFEGSAFNQPIGEWEVSNVQIFYYMFVSAFNFNQPLNDWDTSSATDFEAMFQYATNFNQPLSNWNTSKVRDMDWMFDGASAFNQDLSGWDVTSVTSTGHRNVFQGTAMEGVTTQYPDPTWTP